MTTYHLRRSEKAITDENAIRTILTGQKYMTLAMCRENQPYLVTLNYGYDAVAHCLYFHCASQGKKLDYLYANPLVWGQILEDRGYIPGQCNHAFACLEFHGRVDFLETFEEKCHALAVMIDQLEPDPQPVKDRTLLEKRLANVTIGRVHIAALTAKQNDPE